MRETRLPLDRIKQGTPVLVADDDVFTNHIHADDLARATVAALFRGRPNRAYNVTDDAEMKMGGWFDTVADAFHLPRPPRVSWEEAEQRIAPMLLSFMSESRRLSNARMKRELRVRLRYPTPQELLRRSRAARPQEAARAAALTGADARSRSQRGPDPAAAPVGDRSPGSTPTSGSSASTSRSASCCCCGRRSPRCGSPRAATPTWTLVLMFTLGTMLMRSAGCAINDWADRAFDPHVKRTAARPLADGRDPAVGGARGRRGARVLRVPAVLATNRTTILLSLPAVVIAGVYPFFKRFFALPQAFLGIAFSFGIPMAFAAVFDEVPRARLVAAARSTCSG